MFAVDSVVQKGSAGQELRVHAGVWAAAVRRPQRLKHSGCRGDLHGAARARDRLPEMLGDFAAEFADATISGKGS